MLLCHLVPWAYWTVLTLSSHLSPPSTVGARRRARHAPGCSSTLPEGPAVGRGMQTHDAALPFPFLRRLWPPLSVYLLPVKRLASPTFIRPSHLQWQTGSNMGQCLGNMMEIKSRLFHWTFWKLEMCQPPPDLFMVHFSLWSIFLFTFWLSLSLFGQEITLQMTEHRLRYKVQTKKHRKSVRFPRHKKLATFMAFLFLYFHFKASMGTESDTFER